MEPTPSREDELARLCNRAQALVREHAWLGDEIRAAFLAFMELSKRFGAKTTEIEQHRQRQIRELLTTKGRLVDPETRKGGIACYDYFYGLCPTELDKCLRETSRYEVLPRKLERKAAAAERVRNLRPMPEPRDTQLLNKFWQAMRGRAQMRVHLRPDRSIRAVIQFFWSQTVS